MRAVADEKNQMEIAYETVVEKSVDEVWEVLGNQFAETQKWASPLRHTQGFGKQVDANVCDTRACDVEGMGKIREQVTEFHPQEHVLGYEVIEGLPSFVARGTNR